LSSTKFLDTISSFVPGSPSARLAEVIAGLNPDKIYLENVRSALGVSSVKAQRICESAVRRGVFRRGVEVACPDGSAGASAQNESELPKTIRCRQEERGDFDEIEIATDTLPKTVFYRLND
jgi:hypothetical protein